MKLLFIFAGIFCLANAKIYLQEEFNDDWRDKWVDSKHKSDYGEWKLTAGKFYGDAEADKVAVLDFQAMMGAIKDYINKDTVVSCLDVGCWGPFGGVARVQAEYNKNNTGHRARFVEPTYPKIQPGQGELEMFTMMENIKMFSKNNEKLVPLWFFRYAFIRHFENRELLAHLLNWVGTMYTVGM